MLLCLEVKNELREIMRKEEDKPEAEDFSDRD
jgi:hypothetical protein